MGPATRKSRQSAAADSLEESSDPGPRVRLSMKSDMPPPIIIPPRAPPTPLPPMPPVPDPRKPGDPLLPKNPLSPPPKKVPQSIPLPPDPSMLPHMEDDVDPPDCGTTNEPPFREA